MRKRTKNESNSSQIRTPNRPKSMDIHEKSMQIILLTLKVHRAPGGAGRRESGRSAQAVAETEQSRNP